MASFSPTGSARAIDVYLRAHDETAAAFASADARVSGWSRNPAPAATPTGTSFFGGGAQSTALSGKWAQSIARGAGIVIGLNTAIGAVNAGLDIMKGDWDAARKAISDIPLLGGTATGLADLFDRLFLGIKDEIRAMEEASAANAKWLQAAASIGGVGRTFAQKKEDLGLSGVEKDLVLFGRQGADAIEKIRSEAKKAGEDVDLSDNVRVAVASVQAWQFAAEAAARTADSREQIEAYAKAQAPAEKMIAEAQDAVVKTMMSEADFIKYQVDLLGLSEEKSKTLLGLRLDLLRVSQDQAAAEKKLVQIGSDWKEVLAAADAEAKTWADEVNAAMQSELEAWQELVGAGASLADEMRTPYERLADDLARYQELLAAGTITQETFNRAVASARQNVYGSSRAEVRRDLSALEQRFISHLPGSALTKDDPNTRILRRMESYNREQRDSLRKLAGQDGSAVLRRL